MRYFVFVLVFVGLATAGVEVRAEGFGQPLEPQIITLEKKRVKSILRMLPKLAKQTSQYQVSLLSGLSSTGGVDALSLISNKDMEKIKKIMAQYNFTMEAFVGELSILVATYAVLEPQAFKQMLSYENHPQIQRFLKDPKQ